MADQQKYTVTLEFQTTGADKEANALREFQRGVDGATRAGAIGEKAQNRLSRATNATTSSVRQASASLPTLRYAMYDVSRTAAVMSAAIAAAGTSLLVASASFETSFTAVERTSGATGDAVLQLRDDLVQLTREIPQSFGEIANIAARGAQLGIASGALSEFTDTVAQFVATSDTVSLDQAVEAFGRISNLLGDTDFNRIGSAISMVGVNAAATEAQIVKTTQELAPFATAIGLSTDQTVALAAALASLGQPPERARSAFLTLQRVMDTSIAEGSENLHAFADLLGVTSDEVTRLWKQDPGEFISAFADSLGSVEDLTTAFADLGINERRAVQVFQALAADSRNAGDGVSVLSKAMQDSAQGYEEGTELARQYGLIVDDLSAKWQLFLNSLQEFAATAGAALAPLAKTLLEVITAVTQVVTDLLSTSGGRFFSGTLAAIAGLSFVIISAVGSFAFLVATLAGVRTALTQVTLASGGSLLSFRSLSAETRALAVAMGLSTRAINTFKYALASTGIGLAVLAVGSLIAAMTQLEQSAEDAFRSYVGGTEGLAEALAADQAAFDELDASGAENAADGFIVLKSSIEQAKTAQDDQREGMEAAADLLDVVLSATEDTSKAIEDQSVVLGENATEWLKNSLIQSEAFQNLAQNADFADTWAEYGLTIEEVLQAAADGGEQGVLDLFTRVGNAANDGAGVFLTGIAQFFVRLGDSWNFFWSEFASQVSTSWDALMAGDFSRLGEIRTSAADALGAGMVDIWTSPTLSLDTRKFSKAASGMVSEARVLDKTLGGIPPTLDDIGDSAGDNLGNGSGGLGGAAKDAAREVRLVTDYAKDLAEVWTRAFDIRFSAGSTRDAVSSTLISLREAAEDSAKAIRDLRTEIQSMRADLQSLQSDISIQEYFLSIALEYGDSERAAAIEAELAKLRADLAKKTNDLSDKQKELRTEQEASNKTLTGSSKAAIENRKTIEGLVQQYQSHIEALASSGLSQEELAKATASLRADFIRQATQLGFNRSELNRYAAAFDDVSVAIAKVPRNVTVEVRGKNAALAALEEIRAKAQQAAKAVGGVGGGGGGGLSGGGGGRPQEPQPAPRIPFAPIPRENLVDYLNQQIKSGSKTLEQAARELGVSTSEALNMGLTETGIPADRFGKFVYSASPQAYRASKDVGINIGHDLSSSTSSTAQTGFNTGIPRSLNSARNPLLRVGLGLGTDSGSSLSSGASDRVRSRYGSGVSSGMNQGRRGIKNSGTSLGNSSGSSFLSGSKSTTRSSFGSTMSSAMAVGRSTMRSQASSMGESIGRSFRSGISWYLDLALGRGTPPRNIAKGLLGFQSGGFTGRGGRDEFAGIVHKGEYVVPQNQVNQSTGLPNADALGRLMGGITSQGRAPQSSGSGMAGPQAVSLTAGTIQAIAQATGKNIFLNGKLIADSSSESYSRDNVLGAN